MSERTGSETQRALPYLVALFGTLLSVLLGINLERDAARRDGSNAR